ncbi:MAG TPA: hypothetical protein VIJ93_07310 [bacterium]
MSEIPAPYNPTPKKRSDLENIAAFLNYFLVVETLEDMNIPDHLALDYDDMNVKQKKEWYEFSFNAMFIRASQEILVMLRRQLNVVELNLIKRRIVDFFKQAGIEYLKD